MLEFLDRLVREDPDRVREAMKSLPEREREFVELYFFQRVTQVEIAEKHGVGLPVVGYRLLRAQETIMGECPARPDLKGGTLEASAPRVFFGSGRMIEMSYDLDADSPVPCWRPVAPADPRDLEVIVMLLEVAALELTDCPSSTFTEDELIDGAVTLGGDEVPLDRGDARIVIRSARFLKKSGGRLRLR